MCYTLNYSSSRIQPTCVTTWSRSSSVLLLCCEFFSFLLCCSLHICFFTFFFFFNDPATTEISPLPLPDALPIFFQRIENRGHAGERVRDPDGVDVHREPAAAISGAAVAPARRNPAPVGRAGEAHQVGRDRLGSSEEHTSELQSRLHLVCRLLLEK